MVSFVKHMLVVLAVAGMFVSSAQANDEQARSFVKTLTEQTLSILNEDGVAADAKEDKLMQLFGKNVDFDWVGKFVLGKYWREATDDQKKDYLRWYRDFVLRNYTSRFREYTGESVNVLRTEPISDGKVQVNMEIVRPKQEDVRIDLKLKDNAGELKIYDIVVEGVSLIATQRSEFASVVSRKGLDYLISQLEAKSRKS